MLDIQYIRDNKEKVKDAIFAKNLSKEVSVDDFLTLDGERKKLLAGLEEGRATQNRASKEIAQASDVDRQKKIDEMSKLKESLKEKEQALKKIEGDHAKLYQAIPNVYADDVPVGKDENTNKIMKKVGEPTNFDFKPKDHMEIGKNLGIIDQEKSAQISGARFSYLFGGAAMIQFALLHFAMETLTNKKIIAKLAKSVDNPSDKPFLPVAPPVIMKQSVMKKMDRLDPIEERYTLIDYDESDDNDQVLVGSAEHAIGPLHMNEILKEEDLPIRYVGYSSAFRREAGSYGKDTKGILRLHQFEKVEMESFSTQETGMVEHELMIAIEEYLMQELELPYQVVLKCTGDIGKPNFRGVDIETWMPGQNKYRETHSADYMTDFQSRRLSTKYKSGKDKNLAYMNDATAFAIGRMVIAILENNQQADGSVIIPKALQKFAGMKKMEIRES
ncbi:serine--tRNA ligase [Patescibacteria group bacterium]